MNKLSKLGLTALAGSLVATSAYAGALSVSGGASLTYVSVDETEVSGQPFSTGKGITFGGSGEMDNGWTMNYSYTMSNAAFSSSYINMDMGSAGTLGFYNSSGATGISAFDDTNPSAGEEVWDDLDGKANGIATITKDGTWGYSNSFGGADISASFNRNGANEAGGEANAQAESSKSVVLSSSSLVDGLMIGIGIGDKSGSSISNGVDQTVVFAKYTAGAVTFGAHMTDLDNSGSTADVERRGIGISFAVNENLSVSYGRSEVDFNQSSKTDQEDSGLAASYTMGSITLAAFANSSDSVGGTAGTDDSVKEVSLTFAF
jgi:outer membrane protein OmpU